MFRLLTLLFALALAAPSFAQDKPRLTIFAAASLTEALSDVGKAYADAGHEPPVFSFAATSALARQIENGAPAALFISADEEWMDYLAARKLIDAPSRVSVLGNSLVLVVPKGEALDIAIGPQFDLAGALKGRKLSLADPTGVPAGRYAQAALTSLGVWKTVEPLVVRADNVRGALTFVERKEAAAGIVYATDAALTDKVAVAGTFPATSHPPISYPLAIIARNDSADARAFRDFLLSEPAKAIYRKYGFAVR
ncbi:MAG: molybdate ABC transporter substrate-binding protein [Rhodospirillaceae bacterium]